MTCEPLAVPFACDACDPIDPDDWQAAVDRAWSRLTETIDVPSSWRRCTHIWRPCPPSCGCPPGCGCGPSESVDVPADIYPDDVIGLIVDGVVDTAPTWIIDVLEARPGVSRVSMLAPVSGWSRQAQDMDRDASSPGTWGLIVAIGDTPVIVLDWLAAEACRSLTGSGVAAVPANATAITEAGVTITLDPARRADPALAAIEKSAERQAPRLVVPTPPPDGRWEPVPPSMVLP